MWVVVKNMIRVELVNWYQEQLYEQLYPRTNKVSTGTNIMWDTIDQPVAFKIETLLHLPTSF